MVLEKNGGYKTMQIMSKTLERQEVSKEGLPEDMNGEDITFSNTRLSHPWK